MPSPSPSPHPGPAPTGPSTTPSRRRCPSSARLGTAAPPTFTEVEGEWDEVFAVVKAATDAVLPYGSRVSLVLKADIRPGHTGEIDGKIDRLERAIESRPHDDYTSMR